MSAILEGTPDKKLALVTGRAYPEQAHETAKYLGIDVLETTAYDFANGEMYVRYTEPVRGADAFVMQAHTEPINKWIMEQLIMVDAMKRASARSITVVAPFLGYSRQDKKHQGREPITARLIFDLFRAAGADRIMTVDLHAAQEQGFFDGPVDHLTATPVLLDYVRNNMPLENTTIVSPDAGRIKVSEQWAAKLGNLPLAFIHKTRDTTRPNHAEAHGIIGEVEGRDCVVVDDMIDTAGTICEAVRTLKQLRREVRDAGCHAWPAVWSRRGTPEELRRQRNRTYRHRAGSGREAPSEYDRAVCGPIAGRRHPLRVRIRFRFHAAQRLARRHASAQHLRLIRAYILKQKLATTRSASFFICTLFPFLKERKERNLAIVRYMPREFARHCRRRPARRNQWRHMRTRTRRVRQLRKVPYLRQDQQAPCP